MSVLPPLAFPPNANFLLLASFSPSFSAAQIPWFNIQALPAWYVQFPFSTVLPSYLYGKTSSKHGRAGDPAVNKTDRWQPIKESRLKQLCIRNQDRAGKSGAIRCYGNSAKRPKEDLCSEILVGKANSDFWLPRPFCYCPWSILSYIVHSDKTFSLSRYL